MGDNIIAGSAKFGSNRPVLLFCYVCGREFGSKSIVIHEKQCIEKWNRTNNSLPKAQRRPVPQPPADYDTRIAAMQKQHEPSLPGENGAASNRAQIEALNAESLAIYSEQSRVQCTNCNRHFSGEDRLEIHLRSCQPNGYFAKHHKDTGIILPEDLKSTTKSEPPSPLKSSIIQPQTATHSAPLSPHTSSYCTNCGWKYKSEENKFCASCGTKRL